MQGLAHCDSCVSDAILKDLTVKSNIEPVITRYLLVCGASPVADNGHTLVPDTQLFLTHTVVLHKVSVYVSVGAPG